MTLPPRLARLGRTLEFRVAPPLYRRTPIVTLSESSKTEIVEKLHLARREHHGRAARHRSVVLARAGHATRRRSWSRSAGWCRSSGSRCSSTRSLRSRRRHPALRAVIVGEGYEREALEQQIAELGARDWISLPGRVDDATLLDLYRRAWVVASTSAHEGWGMTITEAAACGTPAVATRIAGHADAVVDDARDCSSTNCDGVARALDRVLGDDDVAERLGQGAATPRRTVHVGRDARTARSAVLAAEALRRRQRVNLPRRGRLAIGYGLLGSRCSRTSRRCSRRRARSRPTRSSTSTSIPRRLLARAPSMWDPNIGDGHGHPPDHRLPVPDGPVLLGPRQARRSRLGRAATVARLDPVLRRAGHALPAAHVRDPRSRRRGRRARVHVHAVRPRLRGADLGAAAAVGGAAVDDRVDAQGVARRRDGATRRSSRSSCRSSAA